MPPKATATTANAIRNATTAGRNLLTAADVAAQQAILLDVSATAQPAEGIYGRAVGAGVGAMVPLTAAQIREVSETYSVAQVDSLIEGIPIVDLSGYAQLSGATFSGILTAGASTTSAASLNIPSGVAPTTPTIGDIWHESDSLKFRDSSETQTLATEQFVNSLVDASPSAGDVIVVEETAGDIATVEVQSVVVTGQGSYTIGDGVTQTEVLHSASVETLQAAIDAAFPEITGEVVLVGQTTNTYPAGIQAGDVAVYQGGNTGLVPSDSGWTTRYSVNSLRCCTKTLNGTETGTIPTISSNSNLGGVRVFRGLTESDIEIIDTDGGRTVSPFDAVILNPLKTYKLFRGIEGAYSGVVINTTGWTSIGNQNTAWVKTDTVSGVSSYSDTMSTFDDDSGQYVRRYTMAVPLTATRPITVSGAPGEYTLTWALFGDQDLITIADKALTLNAVPYVGATADVNLGDYGVRASYARLFDIDTPASPVEGDVWREDNELKFRDSTVTQTIATLNAVQAWESTQYAVVNSNTFAATFDDDTSAGSIKQKMTLSADITAFTMSAGVEGQTRIWYFLQDGTGGWTITFSGIDGTEPVIGTAAGELTVVEFEYVAVTGWRFV